MTASQDISAAYRLNFRRLFDPQAVHVALLDLKGVILEVNSGWEQYGTENGLQPGFEFVGKNYLSICEAGVTSNDTYAHEAYLGLLEVMQARRPKFTMVYPCHSRSVRQWYRMWVEPQTPEVPAIIVAHYLCLTKPVTGFQPMPTPWNTEESSGWSAV